MTDSEWYGGAWSAKRIWWLSLIFSTLHSFTKPSNKSFSSWTYATKMDAATSFTPAHGLKGPEIALLNKGSIGTLPSTWDCCSQCASKGSIQTVADLVLTPIQDIAKRCRSSPVEVKRIVDTVLSRTPVPKLRRLDEYPPSVETFTTGSEVLDGMLGGGLRTGMVWEVVGER